MLKNSICEEYEKENISDHIYSNWKVDEWEAEKKTQKHKVLEKIREKLQCFFLLLVLFSSIFCHLAFWSFLLFRKEGITYLTHHQLKRYIILFLRNSSVRILLIELIAGITTIWNIVRNWLYNGRDATIMTIDQLRNFHPFFMLHKSQLYFSTFIFHNFQKIPYFYCLLMISCTHS